MAILNCRDLTFGYEGREILRDVNFQLESGDYLSIVGENGAGKSTLVKGILNVKKPYGGDITYGEGLKASEIGYLPQQTLVQRDFPATVWEVILSGCINNLKAFPFYRKKERNIAEENIQKLGISDLKHKTYRNLSGGQQQRVLLARALCATKKLLILDEPVAGLDPLVTRELYQLISHINKDLGITIIMVSHDIESTLLYSNKILHLKNSQLFFGGSEEYKVSEIGKTFLRQGGEQWI